MPRIKPNIIVTGTPGVGKSTLAAQVADITDLQVVAVNGLVKERALHDGWDAELASWIVDDDKLLDEMEPLLEAGGRIVDWHACDLFPERLVDLVVVLRAESAILYDRLTARGYPEAKLQNNIDSEIMQVVLEEAREAYDEQIVVELPSNTPDDVDSNTERIAAWVASWLADHPNGVQ